MPIIYKLIITLSFLFTFISCSYKKVNFDSKSGKINTVKVGEKFRITLLENHQQNYYWSLKQNANSNAVTYLGSVFHGDKIGEVDFNFEAIKSGTTECTFNLNHFNDSTDIKVFKVEVIN